MFLSSRYHSIMACFLKHFVQEVLASENDLCEYDFDLTDAINVLESFNNLQFPYNVSDNTTEIGNDSGHINDTITNFRDNFHEKSNKSQLPSNNSHYENSIIEYSNDTDIKTQELFEDDLPTFTTLETRNYSTLQQPVCANKGVNMNQLENNYGADNLDILNLAYNSLSAENECPNENDERIIQNEKNKKRKRSDIVSNHSLSQKNSLKSNIGKPTRIQNYSDEDSEQDTEDLYTNQRSVSIEKSNERLSNAMFRLISLKKPEKIFSNSKKHNQLFHTTMKSNLNELNDAVEIVMRLCKLWIEKKLCIMHSINLKNAFESLVRHTKYIKNAMLCFQKLSRNIKKSDFSAEEFDKQNSDLKRKIEEIKNLLSQLELNVINKISEFENALGNENLEDIAISDAYLPVINFIYKEEADSLNYKKFKIFSKKGFYPTSLSLSKEYIFVCICSSKEYSIILKIDLNKNNFSENDGNFVIKDDDKIESEDLSYGSRHIVIKSSSEGNLILLNSPLIEPNENISATNNFSELTALNNKFEKRAHVKFDLVKSFDSSIQSAIFDFFVHNGHIYALDMKCGHIKVFNQYLVLLKTIPIPKALIQLKGVQLAVSSKYILIFVGKTIHYIENKDKKTEFERLNLRFNILNIAFYDDELIIVRFNNGCYSFRIQENSSEIKYTLLPCLNKLKGLSLNSFIVKDNFVYSLCANEYQIYKLNLTLNSGTGISQ